MWRIVLCFVGFDDDDKGDDVLLDATEPSSKTVCVNDFARPPRVVACAVTATDDAGCAVARGQLRLPTPAPVSSSHTVDIKKRCIRKNE
jgi:hypothetical protein